MTGRPRESDEVPLSYVTTDGSHRSRKLAPNVHRKPHGNPAAGIPEFDSLVNFS